MSSRSWGIGKPGRSETVRGGLSATNGPMTSGSTRLFIHSSRSSNAATISNQLPTNCCCSLNNTAPAPAIVDSLSVRCVPSPVPADNEPLQRPRRRTIVGAAILIWVIGLPQLPLLWNGESAIELHGTPFNASASSMRRIPLAVLFGGQTQLKRGEMENSGPAKRC